MLKKTKSLPKPFSTINEYIAAQADDVQPLLKKIDLLIQKTAPDAENCIKYGMPTYVQVKNLVHFSACKQHVGFYPAPSAIQHFKKKLSGYKCSKGAIQFPLQNEMPFSLMEEIVKFRLKEIEALK